MPLAGLSAGFQSLSPLPTSKLGPSGADSRVGGFVYILGPCGPLQRTLLRDCKFLPSPQPPQVFPVRGCEAMFFHAGILGCAVCLAPQLLLPVYWHADVGLPGLPATALLVPVHLLPPAAASPASPPVAILLCILSAQLPISAPPTGLDECFFFDSLVVGLPYSLIFW